MNIRRIGIIILILTIIVFLYYRYFLTSTIIIATLEEKIETNNTQFIKVRSADNTLIKVKVPEIVWPFLEEGSEYSINYKRNELRYPFVTYITPIDKK
ncbi:hypothetical protein [Paenibacillus paeoniae]|uniref:hypothetical protein n=1 Tax=Paenibacillus paeoniae TaxID=2292705 RepID=UPI001058ADBA|nr:hypothetical protein [Paenibacillus paeoniae]